MPERYIKPSITTQSGRDILEALGPAVANASGGGGGGGSIGGGTMGSWSGSGGGFSRDSPW